MKQAVFFVTHIFNKNINKRLNKLINEIGDNYDVYITGTDPNIIPEKYKDIYFPITIEDLRKTGAKLYGSGYLGNCHLTPLILKGKIKKYDYYWFIEYDVIFNGDWNIVFKSVKNDNSDLITTHIYTHVDDQKTEKIFGEKYHFTFWDNLFLPKKRAKIKKIRAFLPFYRISSIGIALIQELIVKEKWRGHFESLLPTALVLRNKKISQFGGNSRFTPKKRKNLFYHSFPSDPYLGEFRYRPGQIFTYRKNTLYHPVKKFKLKKMINGYYKNFINRCKLYLTYTSVGGKWEEKINKDTIFIKIGMLLLKIIEDLKSRFYPD